MLRLAAALATSAARSSSISTCSSGSVALASTARAATAATESTSSTMSTSSSFYQSIRSFAARAAPADAGEDRKAATRNAVLVKALTPHPPPSDLPPPSPEDLAEASARARAYSRAKAAVHRARQRDLAGKLRLKLSAVAALPEGPLRDAALEPDLAPFPSSRPVWTDTPPIPGFGSGAEGGVGGGGGKADERPVGAGRRRR